MSVKNLPALWVCMLIASLSGCTFTQTSDNDRISGTVSFREKVLLSPAAELEVKLQDVSLADVAAKELGTTTITNPGQPPIIFSIDYDRSEILPEHSYSVRATIYERGRMRFTTDTAYPVLTRGAGNTVEMMLIAVDADSGDVSLTETRWILASAYGEEFVAKEGQATPFIQLNNENNAVNGNSGCNNFAGTYALEDGRLELGPLATTMMACIDNDVMATEQRFTRALSAMDRYEISGDRLTGYQGDRRILILKASHDDQS